KSSPVRRLCNRSPAPPRDNREQPAAVERLCGRTRLPSHRHDSRLPGRPRVAHMDPALAAGTSASQASFLDGLGERRRATDATGAEPIERLYLRADLTRIPSFEFALRERASRLAAFRHPCFARVRSIDRLNDAASTLAVVSDAVRGVRLATLLTSADRPTIDINAAIHLIRQLVNAVAVLHEHAPDVGHGAIAP